MKNLYIALTNSNLSLQFIIFENMNLYDIVVRTVIQILRFEMMLCIVTQITILHVS